LKTWQTLPGNMPSTHVAWA